LQFRHGKPNATYPLPTVLLTVDDSDTIKHLIEDILVGPFTVYLEYDKK